MPIQKTSKKLKFLEARVLKTIREHGMICQGDRVLVAVSGGVDSMALLHCLHTLRSLLGCELAVAHLNHSLRGEEGDSDETFVRRVSEELGLEFVSETVDVKKQATDAKQNLEQVAREKRYEFLSHAAGKMEAQKVAVGHNQNDQMETALFRFMRGSGIEGLSAIHPIVDGYLVRPLLECTRKSILEYLKLCECVYREDSSNKDLSYSRNRIRHELVPYLEKHFNPRLVRIVARESAIMRETWDFILSQAEQSYEMMSRSTEDGIVLEIPAIEALHPALQKEVLRCALKRCRGHLKGIAWVHIEAVLCLCLHAQSGERITLPQNTVAVRQFDELLLLRSVSKTAPDYHYELQVPGYCYVAEARAGFRAEIYRGQQQNHNGEYASQAFLEPSVLRVPLIIRPRIAGDRYGGATHRKVKKMLIDKKIPQLQRNFLPMVVSGGDVVWIPGFKPAKTYRAVDLTKNFVRLEFIRDAP